MSRVLIVEDEDRVASFLVKGLRASGFATTVALAGKEALELTRREDFDLLLLDLGLPDADGLDVLGELRCRNATLPVIVVTARSRASDKQRGFKRGADDYVVKPFHFDDLLGRIRARLRG